MMEEAHFDPVKAEQFQDGMMRAREKMQQDLDKTAQEHQAAEEQVKGDYPIYKCSFVATSHYLLRKQLKPEMKGLSSGRSLRL